jgi:hypothetical protein
LRIPILLGVLVGVLLALIIGGAARSARGQGLTARSIGEGDLLTGLLVLAAIAIGAFLAYALARP